MDRGKLIEAIEVDYFDASSRQCNEPARCVDAILAEIKAQGYVIVPREPTDEMKIAGVDKLFGSSQDDWGDEAADIYRAMLSALEDQ